MTNLMKCYLLLAFNVVLVVPILNFAQEDTIRAEILRGKDAKAFVQIEATKKELNRRLAAKDYSGALAYVDRLIQLEPQARGHLHLRGTLRAKLGRHQEAVDDFTRAIKMKPPRWDFSYAISDTYQSRAASYVALGRTAEALNDQIALIALDPEKTNFELLRAQLSLVKLEAALNEALAKKPQLPVRLYLERARLRFSKGDGDAATADVIQGIANSLLRLESRRKSTLYLDGIAKRLDTNLIEALELLEKNLGSKPQTFAAVLTDILALTPADPHLSFSTIFYRASAYERAGASEAALRDMDSIINVLVGRRMAKSEFGSDFYARRARIHGILGNLDKALSDANSAIQTGIQLVRGLEIRALVLCAQGKRLEALDDEKRVAELGGKVTKSCR